MKSRIFHRTSETVWFCAAALAFAGCAWGGRAGGPASRTEGENGGGNVTVAPTPPLPTDMPANLEQRMIQWKPGIPGGIPKRDTVCATVDARRYGDGKVDATSAIQSAIDACPDNQVVRLPAGTYRTTNPITLKKPVVLRGDGPKQTRISLDNSGEGNVVRIGGYTNWSEGVAVEAGHTRGSTRLTLADASSFKAGDVVLIDQRDDPSLVGTGGCTWFKRMEGSNPRSLGQMFEITAKTGNQIEISSPLYYSYSADFAPQLSKPGSFTKGAGVEDLYLTRSSNFGGQGWMAQLLFASDSWVKNIETYKVSGRHIALESCYRCEVRESYFHHAWSYNSGANAYGVSFATQTSDSLVEDNVVYYLNIPVAFENSGGGNVFAYNYVDDAIITDGPGWQMPDINTHCSFPYMELIEGNAVAHMGTDNVHGGAGYLTFFRNHASAKHLSVPADNNIEAVEVGGNGLYVNVIGNVLFSPDLRGGLYESDCTSKPSVYALGMYFQPGDRCNIDGRVAQTLLRHGNFDYVTNSVIWDPNTPDHTLPASLYLTGKPAFFGNEKWPWVDPEGTEKVATLPAKKRWEGMKVTPGP